MSTSQPPNETQNVSWREQRRMARQERREARYSSRGGAWVGGAILILLGVVFLLQNTGTLIFGNWWALFILLPAVGAFSAAWRSYDRDGGQISGATLGSLIAGLVFTGLTVVLFFGFDLTFIGPAALILIGVGVLAAALMKPGA